MTLALRAVLALLGVALGLYLLLVLAIWASQERLVFPAPRAPVPDPAEWGLAAGRIVDVPSSDSVTLRGWYLPPEPAPSAGTRAPALLWFYGNGETVAFDAPVIRELRPPGWALLVLDYRGYGGSTGSPSEAGLRRDAEAAWSFLVAQPEVDPARVALYGRSLGSVPALWLAARRPARAVVLDSPFSSGREMARLHYWFVPPLLNRMELDNLANARRLAAPLLVLHGREDAIAPIAMGRAVAAAGRGRLVELAGGHNATYQELAQYREAVWRFLQEAVEH